MFATVLVGVISTMGTIVAASIATRAQRTSAALQESIDQAATQVAAQNTLYAGYGSLARSYQERLELMGADVDAARLECAACKTALTKLQAEHDALLARLDGPPSSTP